MGKFILVVLLTVGIILVVRDWDSEESPEVAVESEPDKTVTDTVKTEKIESEIARTEIQHVSSSKNGIVACPTSTGIERFIDVAVDDSKDDNDRTTAADNNNCKIVGERDVITLLTEKQADGSTPLAGQYTYEIGTSAFAIILVDIERGENRVPSARDIEDGRYWVITSIVFDKSWEKGKEPLPESPKPVSEPEPEPEPEPESPPEIVLTVKGKALFGCETVQGTIFMDETHDDLKEVPEHLVVEIWANQGCTALSPGDKIFMVDNPELYQYNDQEFVKFAIEDRWGNRFERWMRPASIILFTDLIG